MNVVSIIMYSYSFFKASQGTQQQESETLIDYALEHIKNITSHNPK